MKITSTSKNKNKNKNILLQLCALALVSGSSVLARDTPIVTETQPRTPVSNRQIVRSTETSIPPVTNVEAPDNPKINLPDLVPLFIEAWPTYEPSDTDDLGWFDGIPVTHFKAFAAVGNFGTADAGTFYGCIEFKVIETTDPVNWPVGKKAGFSSASFLWGADVMDIAYVTYCNVEGFYVPKCVTKAEVVLIVDKYFKYQGGTPEYGVILESDEDNNTSAPFIITQKAE